MIPADYWNLNCWTGQEKGHSTFTFPFITASKRIYLSIGTFLYQIKTNPRLARKCEQSLEDRIKLQRKIPSGGTRSEETAAVLKDMLQCPIVLKETDVLALVVEE